MTLITCRGCRWVKACQPWKERSVWIARTPRCRAAFAAQTGSHAQPGDFFFFPAAFTMIWAWLLGAEKRQSSSLSLSPPPISLSRSLFLSFSLSLPSLPSFLSFLFAGSAPAAQSLSPRSFSCSGEAGSDGTSRFQHHGERPTFAVHCVW